MAQANFTPIQLYRSTTASAVPTSGNLADGELAINTNDGKLYYKDSGGTVQLIASKAGASGDVVGPASATDNAVVRFDGTTGKLVQNSVVTIADTTGNISGVGQLNATTVDTTNLEVTNIKAIDGTAAASIANSTGVVSITANPVLSGGTANGVLYLNGSKVATSGSALTFDGTAFKVTGGNAGQITLDNGGQQYTQLLFQRNGTANTGGDFLIDGTGNTFNFRGLAANMPFVWSLSTSAGSPVERMRLTSTGTLNIVGAGTAGSTQAISFNGSTPVDTLVTTSGGNVGIGTSSPSVKLDVLGSAKIAASTGAGDLTIGTSSGAAQYQYITFGGGSAGQDGWQIGRSSTSSGLGGNGAFYFYDIKANTTRMSIDSSGNLGLGVTPSAWGSGKAIEVGATGNGIWADSGYTDLMQNVLYSAGAYRYVRTASAARFDIENNTFRFLTAPSGTAGNAITFTQAMTLDASGRLGVGTTSPSNIGVTAESTGSNSVYFTANNTTGYNFIAGVATAAGYGLLGMTTNHALAFLTNNTERARITSGGYFKASDNGTYISSTGAYYEFNQSANDDGLNVNATNASFSNRALLVRATRNTTNASFYFMGCYNTTAAAFKMYVADSGDVTNTNGTYGTISDAKMKTDIVDAGSQWADIKAIRFRKFKMKNDPSELVQLGVVAQELEQTSPGLVEEHADRDAEGNDLGTTTKSVKTSILLMKAAKALQEAMARIETLEAKVSALEGN